MRLTAALTLAAVLFGTASCASEETGEYGATTAGPTKSPTPSAEPGDPPILEEPEQPRPRQPDRTVTSLCQLFTSAEVTTWLGLPVGRGTTSKEGPYRRCTWRALQPPSVPEWREGDPVLETDDGIVTITRARAAEYEDLRGRLITVAEGKRAGGLQDLPQIGTGAFAIGASVSGVPIWNAVTLHDRAVVAVEVSGADSRSSIGTVSEFLTRTIERM